MKANTSTWAERNNLVFLGFHAPRKRGDRLAKLQKKWDRSKAWTLNRLLEEGLERHLELSNSHEP
jgi:hypothetical protein